MGTCLWACVRMHTCVGVEEPSEQQPEEGHLRMSAAGKVKAPRSRGAHVDILVGGPLLAWQRPGRLRISRPRYTGLPRRLRGRALQAVISRCLNKTYLTWERKKPEYV